MSARPAIDAFRRIRGLYGILDPSVVIRAGADSEEPLDRALSEALAGGCRLIQYRDKVAYPRLLLSRARRFASACRAAGALFLVNDRIDVALLSEADGCHLGQEDLPLPAARRIAPKGFLLGVSTHSVPEARRAQEDGADYIGVGAIFRTMSKGDALEPRGTKLIAEVTGAVSIPAVAISGITRVNVREVIRAGASAFAVISDLFTGTGVRERTGEFIRIWESETSPR
ncbi:MAG: thiamine phosphate synthase [Deltaproteobacteria bacterium]|nr:thiamine phosphate synthase [Deltaproteobacteria bacterium]PWB60955.1 MAG: thiamine phosphate synthase [Deltaproteobacteria bacterium]